jgi:RNA recognition motif-containing protein
VQGIGKLTVQFLFILSSSYRFNFNFNSKENTHAHMEHRFREQDKEATVYIGNLDERVTDALVWELMLQAGRIVNVHLPKDRVTQTHQGYGFVEFISEEDADYAAKIMNQVRLYGKPVRVNKASADKQKTVEVGAELFIGNLDPMVDEKTLFDTFSRFGSLISAPKVPILLCTHGPPSAEKLIVNVDRTRREQPLQRLWIRLLCRFRGLGRCYCKHERPVSLQQRNHCAIRIQEGWQGRAPW